MKIGQQIIDEIIKQGMFAVKHPDPDTAHVFVWSSGAAEQLEALIEDRLRYNEALGLLKEAGDFLNKQGYERLPERIGEFVDSIPEAAK